MASIGVFTIASKNYLAYARTLMNSVAEIHPEYRRYLCLADEVNGFFDPSKENFEVIQSNSIGIDTFHDMSIRYDIMEFNTAVKPFMIEWLFENTDLEVVIYLDPDIQVYSRFTELESEINKGASVVLTPHITRPLEDGLNPNDYHMLQSGVFNLGFIAVRRCDEAIRFIQWWGRRLATQCAADFSNNLFTDQKWCDLAPCFLDNLKILKNSGYNVAYWNLAQRKVARSANGEWLVNGRPLVFFHFSGMSADRRQLVSKHQNRFKWDDIEPCCPLFENYQDALLATGWSVSKHWPYAYSNVPEGFKVASVIRRLYREKNQEPVLLDDMARQQFLLALCNQVAMDIPTDSDITITDLMVLIYRLRPDVQAVFSLDTKEGRASFAQWFEISGEQNYELPPEMTHQTLIRGLATPLSKKKIVVVVSAISSLEKRIRALSAYLPSKFREKGKVLWQKLKGKMFRLL